MATTVETNADEIVDNENQQTIDEAIEQAQSNSEAEHENDKEPGSENVEAQVKTSDAQEELKPKGDVTPTEDVTGDDEAAQDPKKILDGGRADAKKNITADKKAQPKGTKDGTTDPLEEGRRTAAKNHKAELAASEEANAKRADRS